MDWLMNIDDVKFFVFSVLYCLNKIGFVFKIFCYYCYINFFIYYYFCFVNYYWFIFIVVI